MTASDVELRAALDELANTLQGAVGLAALVRAEAEAVAANASALELAITRAAAAMKRLQPRTARCDATSLFISLVIDWTTPHWPDTGGEFFTGRGITRAGQSAASDGNHSSPATIGPRGPPRCASHTDATRSRVLNPSAHTGRADAR
jgi:hypothetical protein